METLEDNSDVIQCRKNGNQAVGLAPYQKGPEAGQTVGEETAAGGLSRQPG